MGNARLADSASVSKTVGQEFGSRLEHVLEGIDRMCVSDLSTFMHESDCSLESLTYMRF